MRDPTSFGIGLKYPCTFQSTGPVRDPTLDGRELAVSIIDFNPRVP
ncbi:hypothetical protein GCWU000342_00155 [Shuttleworthella satelles DSM 14600]|uniref:Uncharacterized protein n=1 Tax=Shuttleworthella satelles DSM 14600 TaxID=626523 RepID=C4G7Y9_9FIRM|nr:hypothetical protein GCWU000342_00155 [Shuttleworthia satelles DSM 14600]